MHRQDHKNPDRRNHNNWKNECTARIRKILTDLISIIKTKMHRRDHKNPDRRNRNKHKCTTRITKIPTDVVHRNPHISTLRLSRRGPMTFTTHSWAKSLHRFATSSTSPSSYVRNWSIIVLWRHSSSTRVVLMGRWW